jgi:para-nitrobenzyl esterase
MLFTLITFFIFVLAHSKEVVPAFEVDELNPIVTAGKASFVGLWKNNNQSRAFYAIRYGQPPINDLRFRPPVALELEGLVNATERGNRCHQSIGITTILTNSPQSEDCLNLNVYTPTNASNLPVFVYIFGGAFAGQSIQDPMYDGNRMLARTKDVIIVTINYRQAAFGFLASELLLKEVGSLNFGLLDQVLAFDWVKKNIAAFGGDPKRITVAGQSAGALSIAAHLLANKGKQEYFHRAVLLG